MHPGVVSQVYVESPASSLTVPDDRKPLLLGEREQGPLCPEMHLPSRDTPQSHFPFCSPTTLRAISVPPLGGPFTREIDQ